MKAALSEREDERLEALREYHILDTPPEQAFDDLTALAAYVCDVPIALVSLVDTDRQWFKAKLGIEALETSRDISFCAHAILEEEILVVQDTHLDARFVANPLVTSEPNIRFYAGVPLLSPEALPLGTLCVIDHEPRELNAAQLLALEGLARQVVTQLELRRVSARLAVALETINLIEGLIPICSYCKAIRNDAGYWSSVEAFIQQHADVAFTHGVCEACIEKHFPEVAEVFRQQDANS
ncbi:GAF domain-containing protein [Synechococcus sp. CS-1325]|uniref:GAF domain-containing protein n=1 Tax=unclassified Synechococcus TaxID=2626047 RepID=UPI000DB66603|nr:MULTISPECIES: GAF domain-containing protein [unclassified Synechococcus]MCT0199299.1 GAF domain-containing protein [Synechococcus sp. CS-1325]MCT0211913.1 GAF domain-containing protein [Synechococcus sp. CS-1326]MCT0234382.1 GAF domain-containing protein [Synechococcus sp. CS-1327]PZU98506.1 MAG: diguanylate cyclase [Cyanobium sp.]